MGVFSFLFSSGGDTPSNDSEIKEIFPLALRQASFTHVDLVSTYSKILTDAMERTHGLPTALHPLLWDSCLQSEHNHGLISLLAHAMIKMSDLFLVYSPSTGVIRKADEKEQKQIEEDYKTKGESSVGIFVSFRRYHRTEILAVYSSFEYCVLNSLNKSLNVAKAVQIKISDLRASVSLNDSDVAKGQARSIAKALSNGNDIMLDVKDMVETAKVDTAPTEKAIGFLDAKRAFILGLPISYISGLQTPGIGSTGEADMRAVERGLKQYWVSILRPTIKALFGAETEFKSQDFRQIANALEAVKTFDLVSNENLSSEAKQDILVRMFELDEDEEKKAREKDAKEAEKQAKANPQPAPNVPAPGVPQPNNKTGAGNAK